MSEPLTKVLIDVSFTVELPEKIDEDDLSSMTFEIPMDQIGVFIQGRRVPGAEVVEYCTQEIGEFLEGGPDDENQEEDP